MKHANSFLNLKNGLQVITGGSDLNPDESGYQKYKTSGKEHSEF